MGAVMPPLPLYSGFFFFLKIAINILPHSYWYLVIVQYNDNINL